MHPFLSLIGYSLFSADRRQAAELINLCAELGISCRTLSMDADEISSAHFMCFTLSEKKLFCAAASRGIALKLNSRHGLPHFIASHFLSPARAGLTLGLLCACIAVFLSGRVIWDIRIVGNEKINAEEIISLLDECGFYVGLPKSQVHTSDTENLVMIKSDEISWLSINIRGTVATIEVYESLPPPDNTDYIASNIVASTNGVIERFEGIRGNLAVELGESVSEGQLLVGGIYDSNDFYGIRYLRAKGAVFARCEKDFHVEIPLTTDKKAYTGRKKVSKSLIFFKKDLNFFTNSRNLYDNCDKIVTERYFNFFGLGSLPFGIRTETYFEYETVSEKRDIEIALESAYLELNKLYFDSSPEAELLRKQMSVQITDTAVILDCHIVCIQNISLEKEIEVDLTN